MENDDLNADMLDFLTDHGIEIMTLDQKKKQEIYLKLIGRSIVKASTKVEQQQQLLLLENISDDSLLLEEGNEKTKRKKDEQKPSQTLIGIVGQTLIEYERLRLQELYLEISHRYPYYKMYNSGWKVREDYE
jgi:hypothetical protein